MSRALRTGAGSQAKGKDKARGRDHSAATASTSSLTHRRLLRDLAEIAQNKEEGITVHIDDADVTQMCLHLTPVQGDLHGLRLHFAVSIPADTWPIDPPIISASTLVEHPNVFANPGAGGHRICVDILRKETEMTHRTSRLDHPSRLCRR